MDPTLDLDRTPHTPDVERELEELRARLQLMESEKTQLVAERDGLLAKIHYLTQLLQGHVSEKRPRPATLLGLPVDAGTTAAEAESKQTQREDSRRNGSSACSAKTPRKAVGSMARPSQRTAADAVRSIAS